MYWIICFGNRRPGGQSQHQVVTIAAAVEKLTFIVLQIRPGSIIIIMIRIITIIMVTARA